MEMRFNVTFRKGTKVVAHVEGQRDVDVADLTVGEVTEGVTSVEAFLEKLTGLRVHVEQVN